MISIVVPIYNEQEVLVELHRRVTEVMKRLSMPVEFNLFILIDDGSTD